MKITSAQFAKGARGSDSIFEDGIPQVAFIGRSNVGKSSVINFLVGQNDLAKTSSFPGRTQKINLFLINKALYFVDLPGKVATLREGFELAIEAIRSGAGFRKLEEFIDVTKGSRKALSTIIGEG